MQNSLGRCLVNLELLSAENMRRDNEQEKTLNSPLSPPYIRIMSKKYYIVLSSQGRKRVFLTISKGI